MSEASDLTDRPAPSQVKPRVPERTKQALIAFYAVSGSIIQTAQRFNIHRNTVRRILLSVRNDARTGLSPDWRASTTTKAVRAVDAGLDCESDPYKRGQLGNQVLIGLGLFKAGPDINVGVAINNTPPELMERWISTTARVSATPLDSQDEDPDPK